MKLNRCPICHNHLLLEAMAQDEAARDLLTILVDLDTTTGAALASYLGLFRSPNRDLASDRALRLAREVLSLTDINRLSIALAETVEAMRSKDNRKKLANHNYLIKVIESVQNKPLIVHDKKKVATPNSKTGVAIMRLETLKGDVNDDEG